MRVTLIATMTATWRRLRASPRRIVVSIWLGPRLIYRLLPPGRLPPSLGMASLPMRSALAALVVIAVPVPGAALWSPIAIAVGAPGGIGRAVWLTVAIIAIMRIVAVIAVIAVIAIRVIRPRAEPRGLLVVVQRARRRIFARDWPASTRG